MVHLYLREVTGSIKNISGLVGARPEAITVQTTDMY